MTTTDIVTVSATSFTDSEDYPMQTGPLAVLARNDPRNINVTLEERVITPSLLLAHPELEGMERGFTISDRDFNRLGRLTSYAHAFNTTHRATKVLLDDVELDAVTYKFDNGLRATYTLKELA